MPGPQARQLRLTSKQRQRLQELTRSQTVEYRLRFWAKGLLLLADGATVSAVAGSLSTTRTTVQKWRDRFLLIKQEDALVDLPRAGRPPSIPLCVRLVLVHIACDRPSEHRVRFRELWTQTEPWPWQRFFARSQGKSPVRQQRPLGSVRGAARPHKS